MSEATLNLPSMQAFNSTTYSIFITLWFTAITKVEERERENFYHYSLLNARKMIRIYVAYRDIYSITFKHSFPLPDLATKGGPRLSGYPTHSVWSNEAE